MKFDFTYGFVLKGVSIKGKEKDGFVTRSCRIKLLAEFDDLIAGELGPEAKKTLQSLKVGAVEKAVMPIDRINVHGVLDNQRGDRCDVGTLYGIKARARCGKKEGEEPSIELEFGMAFNEASWAFLGRNALALCEVTFSEVQLELARKAS